MQVYSNTGVLESNNIYYTILELWLSKSSRLEGKDRICLYIFMYCDPGTIHLNEFNIYDALINLENK